VKYDGVRISDGFSLLLLLIMSSPVATIRFFLIRFRIELVCNQNKEWTKMNEACI